QDYDLWLRIARCYAFAYIPEQLAVYRLHPGQGMWQARDSLLEELHLLERVVGEKNLLATPEMRQRRTALLDQLSIAHLDARDVAGARECSRRSLRLRWSWRNALLLALTLLPFSWSEPLRRAGTRLRAFARRRHSVAVPSWTKVSTPQAGLA